MNERIVLLPYRVIKGEHSDYEEQGELDEWIALSPHNNAIYDEVTDPEFLEKAIRTLSVYSKNKRATWNKIKAGITLEGKQTKVVAFFQSQYGRYAAAITLLIVLTRSYFLCLRPSSNNNIADANKNTSRHHDIDPGGGKAILQLAEDPHTMLDNAANETLAQQVNMTASKKQRQIRYTYSNSNQLAYGSRIWLNAESSTRYPIAFTGSEHKVEATSEAYSEMAKDAKKELIIKSNDVVTEVWYSSLI